MNKEQIEEYMGELSIGQVMCKLPSEERKKLFQQMVETAPDFSAKRFSLRGLKGSFGLSDQHRKNISAGIKASLAKKGALT